MLLVFLLLVSAHAEYVFLEVYYESLCPDSRHFIVHQLGPVFQKLRRKLAIRYVPFGNANVSIVTGKSISFTCQHGPEECRGNIIHACALKHRASKFPICMFNSTKWQRTKHSGSECAKKLGVNWKSIQQCADGTEGKLLHLQYAGLTATLDPVHKSVPWIVINGKHTDKLQQEAETNLGAVVCRNYKKSKPSACNSF